MHPHKDLHARALRQTVPWYTLEKDDRRRPGGSLEMSDQASGKQRALLAGGTGLVGGHILRLLSREKGIGEVRVVTRRALPAEDRAPGVTELITDFERLSEHPEWFNVDMVFCALGSTIAKARTRRGIRRVVFAYPLAMAKAARSAGARLFLLVSAIGADPRSRFFYNRVKGELEEAVQALGYPSLIIAPPSMLLGKRREFRIAERIAKRITWLLPPSWSGVEAFQVATALVRAVREARPGVAILHNNEMRALPTEKQTGQ